MNNWRVVEVVEIDVGKLRYATVQDGLSQNEAERRAQRTDSHIAIPEVDNDQ